jgi:predicted acylesterase/phospholipase RssA
LKGLEEVGLLDGVDSVSAVSGGSLFGAAWVISKKNGTGLDAFLAIMANELAKGFVGRSLMSWNLFRVPFPGYDRTDLFADAFDRIFFNGAKLSSLPEKPALCLNTTVLNTGQVGKFTREGFETSGRYKRFKKPLPLEFVPQLASFPLSLAVIASAAFPIGLKPVSLRRGKELPADWGKETEVESLDSIQLTDGGVLENLGVQTLLDSPRLARWDLIVSDAGTAENLWKPTLGERMTAGLMWAVSNETLKGISVLMNNKNDRHTRHEVLAALEESWLGGAVAEGKAADDAMKALLAEMFEGAPRPLRRRKLLMVRVDQSWEDLFARIAPWRLVEFGAKPADAQKWSKERDARAIEAFLEGTGVNLQEAKAIYDDPQGFGGRKGVERANAVTTNFTALSSEDLAALFAHARWQVHALKAVYWA